MVNGISLRKLRRDAADYLRRSGNEEAAADSAVLLMHELGLDKTRLVVGDMEIDAETHRRIFDKLKRIADGEPVQYIVGECEFMSLKFSVCHGVLIPRADTEVLAETALEHLRGRGGVHVWDMCSGSGCIGLSLAAYAENVSVTLADISDTALDISRTNAERLISADRVEIVSFDVLNDSMPKEADAVVSNPPYIRTDEICTLDAKVRCYEPKTALDGGADGLLFYRRIAETAAIKKGGFLAFEVGYTQAAEVSEIMSVCGYKNIETVRDTEGRRRVVTGER